MEAASTTTGNVADTPPRISRDGTRRGQSPTSQAHVDKATAGSKAKSKAKGPAVPVEAEDGVPQQLAEMRHVMKHPEGLGESPGLKATRKWFKEDVKGFMGAKTRLEEAVVEATSRKKAEGGDVNADEGSAGCEEMYERLLKEWGEELR